jgi:TPR repeat protein
MQRVLPDLSLLCPGREQPLDPYVESARSLAQQGRQCVVWLDDLEYYLGPSRLDQVVLRQLVRCRAVLLATIRLSEYNQHAPRATGTAKRDDAYARIHLSDPVLRAAHVIDLPRKWSQKERVRTEVLSDPRLLEALRHYERYGVAEYLSAGPSLWERWRNARYAAGNPRGHALVSAAVDLARAGLSPVSMELLTSLHTEYLADEESVMLTPEPLDEAIAWACRDPIGVSRLLMPAESNRWRPFEYLVDMTSAHAEAPPVPQHVREIALENAVSVHERYGVGVSCYRAGHTDLALRAFLPSAESGHLDSMLYVGSILLDQKKEAEAETWWLRLAKAGNAQGMVNLGVRYVRKGRQSKAEKWWRRALEAGAPDAAAKLARVHEDRGEHEEAERLWNVALSSESPDAFFRFGLLAYRQQEYAEAERLYLEGARRGHREATTNLAQLYYFVQQRHEEAEKLYHIAAEAGDSVAMRALGVINEWRGRMYPVDESEQERERRVSESLEQLFEDAEREKKWDATAKNAQSWYRRAFKNGDLLSMRLLGNLYQRRGKYEKAHKCYHRAAKAGDPVSMAYFNQPVLAWAQPLEVPLPAEDDDSPWAPSPRTLRVLEAALEIEADMAADGLKELQDRPLTAKDWGLGCFDQLPSQTWEQGLEWRREMIRAFDDLADDIKRGRLPRPRCTGEEMALHLALEHAAAITVDSPDLAEDFAEGLPEQPDDYDWFACKDLLFEDHDVLMLYEPWMEGIDHPHNHVNQQFGMVNLRPADWFKPFRQEDARDPGRGFRH